jgi:type III restriction enzyme
MADSLIENPILNSPFLEPERHFKFSDEGITNEVVDGRRSSSYFIPIARPKKKSNQLAFDTEWTQDRIEENKTVNRIRQRVGMWREGGHVGVTPTTAALLRYWTDPERERKLFFCQVEALETLVYITEVAKRFGDAWIENDVREANDTSNPGLPRLALKMATGSGKTVVMAMLVAWKALNKLANPQDARFSDTFLIVSPGITVGKPGKLGEHVKCVVSVSMLTEGWDANTVTHVLGVGAFGIQLLCEQVVGRALRRMSYAARIRRSLRRAVLIHSLLRLDG